MRGGYNQSRGKRSRSRSRDRGNSVNHHLSDSDRIKELNRVCDNLERELNRVKDRLSDEMRSKNHIKTTLSHRDSIEKDRMEAERKKIEAEITARYSARIIEQDKRIAEMETGFIVNRAKIIAWEPEITAARTILPMVKRGYLMLEGALKNASSEEAVRSVAKISAKMLKDAYAATDNSKRIRTDTTPPPLTNVVSNSSPEKQ